MPVNEASGMVDVTGKPDIRREATATGFIRLKPSTVAAIRDMIVSKGDVLAVAKVAALLAVKDTPRLIPHCHQIPITGIDVHIAFSEKNVEVTVKVATIGKTGVEMEALTGVSAALLTVWDMVKSLEKDSAGGYPTTLIEGIRVVEKLKGSKEGMAPV